MLTTLLDTSPQWIAAFVAGAVFLAVILKVHVASVRRQRQANRHRFEHDLRTRGA